MRLTIILLLFSTYSIAHTPKPFSKEFEPKQCDQIIKSSVTEICYSYTFKGPIWIKYTLYGNKVNKNNIKKRPPFKQDYSIPEQYRSKPSDYTHTGYDRGHLRSDASTDDEIVELKKVYKMSNIVPQIPKMNRYIWIKSEKYERDIATQEGTVFVKIYILYGDKTIKNNVHVPTMFIKTIKTGPFSTNNIDECYLFHNNTNQITKGDLLDDHLISCKQL